LNDVLVDVDRLVRSGHGVMTKFQQDRTAIQDREVIVGGLLLRFDRSRKILRAVRRTAFLPRLLHLRERRRRQQSCKQQQKHSPHSNSVRIGCPISARFWQKWGFLPGISEATKHAPAGHTSPLTSLSRSVEIVP